MWSSGILKNSENQNNLNKCTVKGKNGSELWVA